MNEDAEKLKLKVKELEEENQRLSGILKANGLLEEENTEYPLHNIWLESGKYAGV